MASNATDDPSDVAFSDNLNESISVYALKDVLPVIAAILLIVVLVSGGVGHVLLLLGLRKADKLSQASHRVLVCSST